MGEEGGKEACALIEIWDASTPRWEYALDSALAHHLSHRKDKVNYFLEDKKRFNK